MVNKTRLTVKKKKTSFFVLYATLARGEPLVLSNTMYLVVRKTKAHSFPFGAAGKTKKKKTEKRFSLCSNASLFFFILQK